MTSSSPSPGTSPCSCEEFATLSRRGLLRGLVGTAAALTTTTTIGGAFMSTSYAATPTAPAVLVVLSMRGAVDGMSLVVPHADPVYYAARPRIAIPASRLLAKDGFFGLHPDLAPLLPWWDAGAMAAVHATGLPAPNRSHFAAIEAVEDADPGSSERVGWLNRLIGRDTTTSPLQAIQLGESVLPAALLGPQPAVAVDSVEAMVLSGADRWDPAGRRPRSMTTMWTDVPGPLGAGARAAMQAVTDFAPVRTSSATPANGAVYPQGDLGESLAAAARTIRGDVGAEVITIDSGSWDHHVNLGTLEWGHLQRMTKELAAALAAFLTDLGPLAGKVTVVTLSEFGRRTRENASWGLDHGHGNVMLLLGAGVKGGYHGTWPGLVDTVDADLRVTTDYRSVLSEVVVSRLGASSAQVFPGFAPESVGVMRAP
ncbi:DUF1501 domain-containing protein [Nocardioides daeguensis]|uniref:DUF1501 domain-containing protein n=1 Tax=Nocardioides daeguensis TaxID=908359 RepID=A0ABP6WE81_9ACTN|nr:DUF1501 domain-containing protein [Nocardioides daeguensis]MBV6727901.1 DUF1501 domain-containing protein [Nocardioides daeguensis]MCR1771644.1 DUF1501 domain-containing protein [Nocardioides daeguensis]